MSIDKNLEKTADIKNNKEKGASLVEYGLLVALIVVVAIGALTFLGTSVSTKFSEIGSTVTEAGN